MNSLSMMALLYLTFVLVNVMLVAAEADSATGENKQGAKFVVSTFLRFSLTPGLAESRGA